MRRKINNKNDNRNNNNNEITSKNVKMHSVVTVECCYCYCVLFSIWAQIKCTCAMNDIVSEDTDSYSNHSDLKRTNMRMG